jgi:hydrogenase expression/formation protein HypD
MFRDKGLAARIAQRIADFNPSRKVKIMHVCGSHEATVTKYGLRSLLPDWLEIIGGPGCPVCVTSAKEIDEAIELAKRGYIITTFGDMFKVPGTQTSLAEAKTDGADVQIVYSLTDAVEIARRNPGREVVHIAIGFETTAPTTAAEVLREPPKNFSLLVCHRLIPPVMELLLGIGDLQIDGFIAPGHVSTIIGMKPYEIFPNAYRMPVIVAGFEPLDVLYALLMLVKQVKEGDARLENEYTRSVTWEGNLKAQGLISEVFDVVEGHWRGIGRIPSSSLKLKENFSKYDAREKYDIEVGQSRDLLPGCSCHLVMIGKIYPEECPLFAKACNPQSPKGPCMVSSEGACNITFKYGRHSLI